MTRIVTAREQAEMTAPWHRPAITTYHREPFSIVARNGNGEMVGYLTWWDPSHVTASTDTPRPQPWELQRIEVHPDYQRQGIATFMMATAQRYEPRVHHSPHMTAAGAAWAKATGYAPSEYAPVPDLGGAGVWNG